MGALRHALWQAALVRAALLSVLWWALVEGDVRSLGLVGLTIASATAASLALMPPGQWRWRLVGLAAFVPFFARLSLLGGLDVARRALHPALPLNPGLRDFRLRLADEPACIFLTNTMSLLPGTLSVDLRKDRLRVHVLDESMPVEETLRALEVRVAALFGLALSSHSSRNSDRRGRVDS